MAREIIVNSENLERIELVLQENRAGKESIILIPDSKLFDKHKVFDVISIIEWSLSNLGINPRFPYPIYFIYNQNIQTQHLPLLRSRSEVPRHFDRFVGRGGERVHLAKQKIAIRRKILSSYSFDNMWMKIKTQNKDEHKKLFDLNYQIESLKQLLKKLQKY